MSSIDLRTVSITPQRQTFDHLAARFGDKPASRYQEATYDIQPVENFQYRPTWAPGFEIFDKARTAIQLKDWYVLKDPRQFYYGTYTLARARMQETAEADFDFVEERGLTGMFPAECRDAALKFYLPLRHVAWGANINNSAVSAYGYGTAFSQAALYACMDNLGIAQYLTRLGIAFDAPAALAEAKQAWLGGAAWQPLRKLVEQTMVVEDIFELFLVQNLVLDGLLFPLAYTHVDNALASKGGPVLSMLTRFQSEWYGDNSKWVDATVKATAAESDANKSLLGNWTAAWRDRVLAALKPVAAIALGEQTDGVMADLQDQFNARCRKLGLSL